MYDTRTSIIFIITLLIIIYWNVILSTKLYELKKASLIFMRGPGYSQIMGYSTKNASDMKTLHDFIDNGRENFSCGYRNYYENPCHSTPYYYMQD